MADREARPTTTDSGEETTTTEGETTTTDEETTNEDDGLFAVDRVGAFMKTHS